MRCLLLITGLAIGLGLPGCSKSDSSQAEIAKLRNQIPPLKIADADGAIRTITLDQAMQWHETREMGHESVAGDHDHSNIDDHPVKPPLCLGVLAGYQAIRYATEQLYGTQTPNAADFEIQISGPVDGAWDMMSLYRGVDATFEGDVTLLSRESFVFTAKRVSEDRVIVFQLREGFIPEKFYPLKNAGATCGDKQLSQLKQQALLNLLSATPKGCFEKIDHPGNERL